MNTEIDIDAFKFQPFSKIPRLSREVVVTEKLDGTNAQILIHPLGNGWLRGPDVNLDPAATDADGLVVMAGSRNRWITPENDNYGFARWVKENRAELLKLGPGRHFGEWWGRGIQRGYGVAEKRFSLFNVSRWHQSALDSLIFSLEERESGAFTTVDGPRCCHVVPTLYRGLFDTAVIETIITDLNRNGSKAAPGFMNPEGIIIFHTAKGNLFKKTCKDDEKAKSEI